MKELWVFKYAPKSVDEYVFRDQKQKNQVNEWIKEGTIPHLLFSGGAGIGKTALALMLFNELKVDRADVLKINASDDNGVDQIRERVSRFASTMPYGEFKYVFLDEADYLTLNAQAVLRGLIEQYAATTRFILTCNYPERIMPALHSRCQGFHLQTLNQGEFELRAATILIAENITFTMEELDTYVKATYPDLRKCINSLQQNSVGGVLKPPSEADIVGESDYKIEMVSLFKQGEITKARKLICANARPEEMTGIFKFLYQNLELWGDGKKQEAAILIIRDGLVNHSYVADPEINLAATLVELANIVNG